LRSSCKQ